MSKCLIIQPSIPAYRVPFFECLADSLGYELTILSVHEYGTHAFPSWPSTPDNLHAKHQCCTISISPSPIGVTCLAFSSFGSLGAPRIVGGSVPWFRSPSWQHRFQPLASPAGLVDALKVQCAFKREAKRPIRFIH